MNLFLMLHTVLEDQVWDQSFLVTKKSEMDLIISSFKRFGFSFAKISDCYKLNKNRVYLTFDDGYLDNWTILFPYLRQHGIPFTIFVNKDFVELNEKIRDWGDKTPGYLSIGEIRKMHESGLVDIQSHSVSHTSFPISKSVEIIFEKKHKRDYPWIMWNRETARKPYWLEDNYERYYGLPVFQSDRSLRAIQYVFDSDALKHFEKRVKVKKLSVDEANKILATEYPYIGRYETAEERDSRYKNEINDNALFIKEITGRHPDILCWPGGAFNKYSKEIAYKYHRATTIKQGYGKDERYIHRISPVNPYKRDTIPWRFQGLTLLYYTLRYATQGMVWSLTCNPLKKQLIDIC